MTSSTHVPSPVGTPGGSPSPRHPTRPALGLAPVTTTPLAAGRFRTGWALARANGFRIDAPYLGRAVFATGVSAAAAPLRWAHRARLSRVLADQESVDDPVVVVGHYRSGTTHLQNLLTRDPRWAPLTTAQALAPELTLAPGPWKRVLAALLPSTRPMDAVEMGVDLPEEPDHALGALSPFSFYHGFAFPRSFLRHYRRNVALEGRSPGTVDRWARLYRGQIRLACALAGRTRAVVKNPSDTGRVEHVLRAFPGARFIFLVRDPATVFHSVRHFYRTTLEDFALQRWTEAQVESWVWHTYEHMQRAWLRDRESIPPERRVEVRFEALEARPLEVLEGIYRRLGLGEVDRARPRVRAYLEARRGYRKNVYPMERATLDRIRDRWRFAFTAWGYPLP